MTREATILITTKNRHDDLRGALASAFAQTVPVEVLVIDDGSDDGTSEMVRAEFPDARLVRNEESQGYIAGRNKGVELATAPIVFSIDDDAVFPSSRTVEQTLEEFVHPRIGAVAIPFVNVRQDSVVRQKAPDAGVWITDRYIGTAHALRREVFLSLGGYRAGFIHQGEEGDFCLRMLASGFVVRLGRADPIHHFESPRRNYDRMDYYGVRNLILFPWYNIPFPDVIWHLPVTTAKVLRHTLRIGRYRRILAGLAAGYAIAASPAGWNERRPVSRSTSRLFRRLKKAGPVPLDAVLPLLGSDPENACGREELIGASCG